MLMFIAALFTVAKMWKQLLRTSTDEWHAHTMGIIQPSKARQLCSMLQHKRALKNIVLSEINQTQREKTLYDSSYMRY